jgi:hypothetical protein
MLFLSITNLVGQEYPFSLHVNKHYFLVNEEIYFSFKASSPELVPEDLPLYITLMKINDNDQRLVKAVKLKWNGFHTNGYIQIPDNLPTGKYLLGVFSSHSLEYNIPLHYCYLYIFNPEAYDDQNVTNDNGNQIADYSSPDSLKVRSKTDLQILMEIITDHPHNQELVKARIISDNSTSAPYHLSISAIDKRFYDIKQNDLVSEANTGVINNYLNAWKQKQMTSRDSILSASKYIYGKLWIKNEPAAIKKVYFYTKRDSTYILTSYITSQDGMFKFPEPDIKGHYPIRLFTISTEGEAYSFELLGRLYSDSTYQLNIPHYSFPYREEFKSFALKKHSIDLSYPLTSLDRPVDIEAPYPLKMESTHEIILEDYIYFPTLPEIIREIVPLVSINYKKGKYQLRVYDSRAKNYCCKGNPLIFVNDDPYPDNTEIMNINTNDIYSIEVIRPIEAIAHFGDIGINGILKINLYPDIIPTISGDGTAEFHVAGFQKEKKQAIKKYSGEYPDFRSFLFWDGNLPSGQTGEFQFNFQTSKLKTEFVIVIDGVSSNGRFINKTVNYNPFADQ